VRNPFERPGIFSSSFVDALRAYAPDLLEVRAAGGVMPEVTRGTTVAAVRFADGVAMGGDRRARPGE
jgi:20S proteasome alpha/beta subunit